MRTRKIRRFLRLCLLSFVFSSRATLLEGSSYPSPSASPSAPSTSSSSRIRSRSAWYSFCLSRAQAPASGRSYPSLGAGLNLRHRRLPGLALTHLIRQFVLSSGDKTRFAPSSLIPAEPPTDPPRRSALPQAASTSQGICLQSNRDIAYLTYVSMTTVKGGIKLHAVNSNGGPTRPCGSYQRTDHSTIPTVFL